MDRLRAIADGVALFVLVLQLPVPLFWLAVHPAVGFWRRHPKACYYGVGLGAWGMTAALLLGLRPWWLAERFSRHPLVALAGVAFIAADIWLMTRLKRHIHWKVLVGLPELMPGRPAGAGPGIASQGVYRRVRHPRYLGMMLAWLGAALLSGATRLLVLVMVFLALAVLVTELEERELLARLGDAYADYRRRVPRFLPRVR